MGLVCENSQSVMLRFRSGNDTKWSQYYSENTPLNVTMTPVPKNGGDGFPNSSPPSVPQNSTGKNRVFVAYKNLQVLFKGKNLSFANGGSPGQYPWVGVTGQTEHTSSESIALYSDGFFVDIPDYDNVPPSDSITTVINTYGPNPGSPAVSYEVEWLVNSYSLELIGNGKDPNYNDDPSSPTNPPGGNGSLEYELKSVDSLDQIFTVRKSSPILYGAFCECEEDCLLVEDEQLVLESTCICSELKEEDLVAIKAEIKAELLVELPLLLVDDINTAIDNKLTDQGFRSQIASDVKNDILNDTQYLRQLMGQLFSQIETDTGLKARFAALVALGTGLQPSPGFDAAIDVAGVKVDIKLNGNGLSPIYVEWQSDTELPVFMAKDALDAKYSSNFTLTFNSAENNRTRFDVS